VTKEKRIPSGQTQRPTDWTTVETRHFWYDGWNLMAETVGSPPASGATGSVAVTHRYAWGVDLGGTWETGMGNHGPGRSQTAAGGVGALLGVIAPNSKTYSATHDANGNVMGFIDLETGTLAARFDYDAFGSLITDWSAPGHNAWEISRIRFSGKYQDPHTGWLYYGYRYLDTVNGRWPSRDPIGEKGGVNLFGMAGNDTVNGVDFLGLAYPGAEQVQPATPDWLPKVSDIARGKGWSHLGRLFDHWFSRPSYTIANPVKVGLGDPYEDTIITFDWLVKGFSRARSEIEKFHNPNTYRNSNERERLRNRLRALGPNTHRFGEEWMNESDPRKLHQHWISQKTVGGSSLFMDALDAALHRFTVQSVVAGCLHKEGDG